MQFWDSSALVQLLVEQEQSSKLLSILGADPQIWVWWGTEVECTSALARLSREGFISDEECEYSLALLDNYIQAFNEVLPSTVIKSIARRLLRVHMLRAADALQLAAALVAADGDVRDIKFVTFDNKLISAARKEGFSIGIN